jgi:hypothetical protein
MEGEPGKLMQNGFYESINAWLQNECPNEHVVVGRMPLVKPWRGDYNTVRYHSSFNDLAPSAFENRPSSEVQIEAEPNLWPAGNRRARHWLNEDGLEERQFGVCH